MNPIPFLGRGAVALLLGPGGATAIAQNQAPPPLLERAGTNYVLRFHGAADEPAMEAMADAALAVVEPVWPMVAKSFGVPDARPAQPLIVYLYRTIEGYETAEQALTAGRFRRNLAMSHHATHSAHVALQPPCSDETLRAVGLPGQTLTLLAWEATHIARFELCPNFADHPNWLTDGLASAIAREVMKGEFGVAPEAIPFFASQMVRVRGLLDARKLPPLKSVLADRIDDLAFDERYATRAQAFAFLASEERAAKLVKLLAKVRSFGCGEGCRKQIEEATLTTFGDQDKAFTKHVTESAPQWEEVFRSLAPHGKEWVQIAFPDKNALVWQRKPIRAKLFVASGGLRILPADAHQLNFLFGRTPEGFYSIAFVADGSWTLFDFRVKNNEWIKLGGESVSALRRGYRSSFKIEVRGKQFTLRLDDQEWKVELPRPLPPEIQWGLGAQAAGEKAAAGSAGEWFELEVLGR
ncbi:MAG: hypothetical protein EXS13_13425 [Planctomycetes bacterium]|nr:hypothetical protein [Planctomycetota bacterium]